jgi:SulP family sulfate permease
MGADPKLEWFCLDAAAIDDVDYSAAAKLRSTYGILKDKGIRLVFVLVSDAGRSALSGQDQGPKADTERGRL